MTETAESNDSSINGGRHAAVPTVGQLVSDASTHLSTIIQGEIELAKVELKSSVKNAGVGIGAFAAAVVLLFFSLTFGFIAAAEGIATAGLSQWLSFLIVFGGIFLLALICVLIGVRKVKKVKAPERTITTGKDTVAYLKANTKRS